MRKLYHFPLCPFSRKVRVLLKEQDLPFELVIENFWERRQDFAQFNPAMQVPVLLEPNNDNFADSTAIAEYLEEKYNEGRFIGNTPEERANIRRIAMWFDGKCYQEVTKHLVNEKVLRYYTNKHPISEAIRAAKTNINTHLNYISFLTNEQKYLAGDQITLADIAAASQISVIDYLGEIPWEDHPSIKEWYALIKSRPSFRPLLEDRIPGFTPPTHYANPDF